jgi:hypothetical protein
MSATEHVRTDRAIMIETTGRDLNLTRTVTVISPRGSNHRDTVKSVIPRYHSNGRQGSMQHEVMVRVGQSEWTVAGSGAGRFPALAGQSR